MICGGCVVQCDFRYVDRDGTKALCTHVVLADIESPELLV